MINQRWRQVGENRFRPKYSPLKRQKKPSNQRRRNSQKSRRQGPSWSGTQSAPTLAGTSAQLSRWSLTTGSLSDVQLILTLTTMWFRWVLAGIRFGSFYGFMRLFLLFLSKSLDLLERTVTGQSLLHGCARQKEQYENCASWGWKYSGESWRAKGRAFWNHQSQKSRAPSNWEYHRWVDGYVNTS